MSKQVKIVTSSGEDAAEKVTNETNRWLAANNVPICDIKMSTCDMNRHTITTMIIYEKN